MNWNIAVCIILFVLAVAFFVWLGNNPDYKAYQEKHKDDPTNSNCGFGAMKRPFMKCYVNGTIAR